ncbi:unnamed protein product [Dibothriocephalus latus]|uniref:G-protein coupled receptors family 1 profile domain-containing protein n=1 Tax=Dibothriocephalus latus TaxID=60516 RepID=A0A3P7N1G0_DIBLA|nr:unnamed protein product [Dibothriocephalus latus]
MYESTKPSLLSQKLNFSWICLCTLIGSCYANLTDPYADVSKNTLPTEISMAYLNWIRSHRPSPTPTANTLLNDHEQLSSAVIVPEYPTQRQSDLLERYKEVERNLHLQTTKPYGTVIAANTTTAAAAAANSSSPYGPFSSTVIGLLTAVISFITISGNVLVIMSFFLERSLRMPTNYFIASLAVTDLLIGVFSMNLYSLYLLLGYWPLGRLLCDLCNKNHVREPHTCYAEFSNDPVFNTILTISYFWITLAVMTSLYIGIYHVALNLQRKSEAKRQKVKNLVNMAGQTMSKLGVTDNKARIGEPGYEDARNVRRKRSSNQHGIGAASCVLESDAPDSANNTQNGLPKAAVTDNLAAAVVNKQAVQGGGQLIDRINSITERPPNYYDCVGPSKPNQNATVNDYLPYCGPSEDELPPQLTSSPTVTPLKTTVRYLWEVASTEPFLT